MAAGVVILIIAHKEALTKSEKASLKQCFRILGKYPVKIICPKGLNVTAYHEVIPDADIVFIDPQWQSSYSMFNELKKARILYEMFESYEYILFYEMDAWVFSDQLEDWCNKGYDYIGAPWFEHYGEATAESRLTGVGNGGFSLRRVSTAKKICKRVDALKKYRQFWFKTKLQSLVRYEFLLKLFKRYFKIKDISCFRQVRLTTSLKVHEDSYWAIDIPALFSDYKIAPVEDAMRFSFEANPSVLFTKNNNQLPFGCHAWEKYQPEFWKQYISFR